MTERPNCLNREDCAASRPERHCRRCFNLSINTDPAIRAKRAASLAKRCYEDPARKAALTEQLQRGRAEWRRDPANREREVQRGRDHAANVLFRPDIRARNQSPEARAAAGRRISARMLEHIPIDYRDEYRRLIRSNVPKDEATRIILDQVDADTRRHHMKVANHG